MCIEEISINDSEGTGLQFRPQLTPWSRVLEKMIVAKLVKKFLSLYGISPLVPTLNQMHPVRNFPSNFLKIHSNIILPSMTRFSEWSLPFNFSDQNKCEFLTSPLRTACLADLILLPLITVTVFVEAYTLWSSSLCSFLHPPATSSLWGADIPLSTLLSNSLTATCL
jgi:hypothetical protein